MISNSEPIFHIHHDPACKGRCRAIGNVRLLDSCEELYEAIRDGYLSWRRQAGPGVHEVQVFAYARQRQDSHAVLVRRLVDSWNEDPQVLSIDPMRIEFWIGNNAESWVGFTNGVFPHNSQAVASAVRLITKESMSADLDAAVATIEAAEKRRRSENPVQNPVVLPRRIKSEIASYLRLEYGEAVGERGSIGARDLTFDGEFVIDGVPTQYWRYPTSQPGEWRWATVERFDDGYCLGMADTLPPLCPDGNQR